MFSTASFDCSICHVPHVVIHRFHQDPNWSETGDRYLLKLFRDYLFHQITPSGTPWLDLAHIVQSLNKVPNTLHIYTRYTVLILCVCVCVVGCWLPGEDMSVFS